MRKLLEKYRMMWKENSQRTKVMFFMNTQYSLEQTQKLSRGSENISLQTIVQFIFLVSCTQGVTHGELIVLMFLHLR